MANFTNIERVINHDVSTGDKPFLFQDIDVGAYNTFCIQFTFKDIVKGGSDGLVQLLLSNDADPDHWVTSGSQRFNVDQDGTFARFLYIGTALGFGNCNFINAVFTANTIVSGTIEIAIFCGTIGA